MSKAIHLSIDMQNIYADQYSNLKWKFFKKNATRLTQGLKLKGIPTVHILYMSDELIPKAAPRNMPEIFGRRQNVQRQINDIYDRHPDFCGKTAAFLFASALPLADDDLVAVKYDYSASSNPALSAHIAANGIDTVILSGGMEATQEKTIAEKCVTRTAIDFARKNMDVCIAFDGTNAMVDNLNMPWQELLARRQEIHGPYGVRFDGIDELIDPRPARPIYGWKETLSSAVL